MTPTRRTAGPVPIASSGLAAVAVAYGLGRYGVGLYLPDLERVSGLGVAGFGLVTSGMYVMYLLAAAVAIPAVPRFGPRAVVVAGGTAVSVGTGLVAASHGPVALVAGLLLAGTSTGLVWAPYSEAVRVLVRPRLRERVLAVVPSGTAFGVVVAGPLALLAAGDRWRVAWWFAAVAAAAATIAALRVLRGSHVPARPDRTGMPVSPVGTASRAEAARLYLTSTVYGLVGSVYWLFAVQSVHDATGGSRTGPALLWTLIGISGVAGLLTGPLLARTGIAKGHTVLLTAWALAPALLAVAPGGTAWIVLSALVYGFACMAGSGLLAVWSAQLRPDRPAAALGLTLLTFGPGAVLGPALAGFLAGPLGLRTVLAGTAAVAAAALLLRPSSARRRPTSAADTRGSTRRSWCPAYGRSPRACGRPTPRSSAWRSGRSARRA